MLTASSEGGEFKVRVGGSNKRGAKFGCQFNDKAMYRLDRVNGREERMDPR